MPTHLHAPPVLICLRTCMAHPSAACLAACPHARPSAHALAPSHICPPARVARPNTCPPIFTDSCMHAHPLARPCRTPTHIPARTSMTAATRYTATRWQHYGLQRAVARHAAAQQAGCHTRRDTRHRQQTVRNTARAMGSVTHGMGDGWRDIRRGRQAARHLAPATGGATHGADEGSTRHGTGDGRHDRWCR